MASLNVTVLTPENFRTALFH